MLKRIVDQYISDRMEKFLDSEKFKKMVADRAEDFLSAVLLRVRSGDIIIMPEDTEEYEVEALLRILAGVDVGGVLLANRDEVGIIRQDHDD